jgi:hypothetical protein
MAEQGRFHLVEGKLSDSNAPSAYGASDLRAIDALVAGGLDVLLVCARRPTPLGAPPMLLAGDIGTVVERLSQR